MTKNGLTPLAALAVFAMACADPTAAPRSIISANGPNLHASTTNGGVIGLASAGVVELCKTTSAGSPNLAWSFTVTGSRIVNAGAPNPAFVAPVTPRVINAVAGTTVCANIFTSNSNGASLDQLVITEQALPANWTLDHVHITQFVTGAGYVPPAPGTTDVGNLAARTATIYINNDMARRVEFVNTFTPPFVPGDEGCTPGYWKQSQHFDSWPVALSTTFAQAGMNFGFTGTLLSGLNAGGGGVNALARHAAAAYLNSVSAGVDYFYSTAQVQAIANGTGIYAGLSIEARKDLLADANEAGCPLN